jgi:hypothetical protein
MLVGLINQGFSHENLCLQPKVAGYEERQGYLYEERVY